MADPLIPLDETDGERWVREHPTAWRWIMRIAMGIILLAIAFGAFIASLIVIRVGWWLTETLL